jgi:hypothetical protein
MGENKSSTPYGVRESLGALIIEGPNVSRYYPNAMKDGTKMGLDLLDIRAAWRDGYEVGKKFGFEQCKKENANLAESLEG